MRFDQQIEVNADVDEVWELLWDIPRLTGCVPGCEGAEEVVPGKEYRVVVTERVGPFKARFEMKVDVIEMKHRQSVHLRVEGDDKKLKASNRTDLVVKLEKGSQGGTIMQIGADIMVMGKIANLGQPIIKRKAQDVLTKFAQGLARELQS